MESSEQINSESIVDTEIVKETPVVESPPKEDNVEIKKIKDSIDSERTQEELAAMLRVLIANFCDEHFIKKVKKAKILMEKTPESHKNSEQKGENSDADHKDKDHIDEIDTANLTLSPPSSSVSNYSQTKQAESEQKTEVETGSMPIQESSKILSSIMVGLDKLEIFGSIHVRSNNVRLLSCLIDEQLTFNNSDVNFSFSSASSSISSAGHYKFHKHRHGHHHHRRHRGRHGYKKFRKIRNLRDEDKGQTEPQQIKYPIKKLKAYQNFKEKKDDREDKNDDEKSPETDNLESLASVAAQAVKLNTEKNTERNRKSRKSSNVVPIHDDSELEYMNDELEGENLAEDNQQNEGLYAEDDDQSSVISESLSDTSLLRHRRHRSNSSLYSEPCSIISSRSASNKNNRLSRSPSLGASSYCFENEYRSYSSCSSLSDYEGYDYENRKTHKRKDKNDRHKSDRKRMNKEKENLINVEDIKCEKEIDKETEPILGESEVSAIEERRREEEYLMRKYKRKFSSFKTTDTHEQNLYLLETSRQHHRVYDVNSENNQNAEQQGYIHQKMLNVNSLVDRLSPISDPDMEHNLKNKNQNYGSEQARNSGESSQKTEILNRINNLSPSSSSSSSSSIKNQNSLAAFHSLQSSQSNNAAAVLAAAAAAAAAAADLRNIHPHHLNSNSSIHNHHAQSVAQLLADMQQQHSQSDAAKVLAATLSNHHSHHSLNAHHLLGRFSNNSQNELMAVLAQQQQQQQHRSLLDSHNHINNHQSSYSTNGQLNQNGPIYNRYSSHLNAAIAAASAAAANMNTHQRRANSVESDATPSPPSTTPAVNTLPSNNGQSISSAASSASSTSENYSK